MATPLTRLGNISERTTQVVGARVMAYKAVATITDMSMMIPVRPNIKKLPKNAKPPVTQ